MNRQDAKRAKVKKFPILVSFKFQLSSFKFQVSSFSRAPSSVFCLPVFCLFSFPFPRSAGGARKNPNRAPPCSLPPPRQKLLCEVLSAKRKEGRGFEPPRRQARQGFPCLRSLSYFSFQISGFSPSSVFCLAVFCLFPLSVFLLFALRPYLLAHYALRRRRSRPAPSSRPASALVGSGTAVQVRLEPLAVK